MGQPVEWDSGAAVLQDGRVLAGRIHYPKGHGLIFIQNDKVKIVLTAEKILSFCYYDSASNINRRFISLNKDKWGAHFYEVVINGEVSVLRELKRYADKSHPDEIDSYRYFTFINNIMVPLMYFRKKTYPKLLEERPIEIQAYVHRENLDPNDMRAAFLIIMEFNRIKQNTLQARAY